MFYSDSDDELEEQQQQRKVKADEHQRENLFKDPLAGSSRSNTLSSSSSSSSSSGEKIGVSSSRPNSQSRYGNCYSISIYLYICMEGDDGKIQIYGISICATNNSIYLYLYLYLYLYQSFIHPYFLLAFFFPLFKGHQITTIITITMLLHPLLEVDPPQHRGQTLQRKHYRYITIT